MALRVVLAHDNVLARQGTAPLLDEVEGAAHEPGVELTAEVGDDRPAATVQGGPGDRADSQHPADRIEAPDGRLPMGTSATGSVGRFDGDAP